MGKLTKPQAALIDAAIAEFAEATKQSADAIKRAAIAYYKAVKIAPEAREKFAQAFPSVSSSTWAGFVKVASDQLDERLLFDTSHGAQKLRVCDIDTQRQLLDNSVAVAVGDGDHIMIAVDKLTNFQARQVFRNGAVRDLAEQRAWLETQKALKAHRASAPQKPNAEKATKPRKAKLRVKVVGDPKRLLFSGEGTLSANEVAEWLSKLL